MLSLILAIILIVIGVKIGWRILQWFAIGIIIYGICVLGFGILTFVLRIAMYGVILYTIYRIMMFIIKTIFKLSDEQDVVESLDSFNNGLNDVFKTFVNSIKTVFKSNKEEC